MSDDPDKLQLENVLEAAFEAFLQNVHTSMPGRITEFDTTTNRATVRPLVQFAHVLEDETDQTDTIADIHDVPVLYPINASGGMTYPVGVGDDVFLHFASCSLSKIKTKGGITDPGDARRNHISDAVAYPAWFSFNKVQFQTATDAVVLFAKAGMKVKAGGSSGTDATFMVTAFFTAFDTLMAALVTALGPSGSAFSTAYDAFKDAMSSYVTQVFEAK